ncbi:type II secretion system protein GspC [Thermovibrio sp.]
MKLNPKTSVNLGLTLFLSLSTSYLISSIALLRAPKCQKRLIEVKPITESPFKRVDYTLESPGFFQKKRVKREPAKVEETVSLNGFKLKGTVVCSNCKHSIAIVQAPSGKTVIVSQGQELEGYKVEKVLPDEVLLRRNGKRYALKIEEKRPKGEKLVELQNRKSFTVNRQKIIKQISSGDFLRYINIVPVKNPEGLRVNYVNPRSFIYKLGIRPGDIIVSINDIRIKSPEDSFAAFERLKSADTITITVIRRGREVKLHYELQ